MISCRNLLMSGQTGPLLTAPASALFTTPEIRADAAVETVYKLIVESVSGAPTTASLTAKFQAALRTTGGNTQGAGAVTDALPIWTDLNADSNGPVLPDGDWPTLLADQTLAAPVMFIRRVLGGFSNRLAITPTFTNGTTPGFVMSLEVEVRYR